MIHLKTNLIVAAIGGLALLSACGRSGDNRSAGQKVDAAVATVEQKAAEVKADVSTAGQNAKESMAEATAKASNGVKDVAITAAINAELARDKDLSALRINVDTVAGKVALTGSAPDAMARDRATTLAKRVDGVVTVDNQLSLKAKS